ncbi:unnamed protein product, partial [Mesorhabditis belari]|uniref:Uncharacterized protein n=1 Tax=Mesorhabditis belari TaxID=2138241 RepID=A0AAF3FKP9_9BILA
MNAFLDLLHDSDFVRFMQKILSLFAATEDGLAKHQSFTTVKWQRPKEIQPANYGRYRDNLRDVKEKPGTSKTENPQKSQKEAKGSKKGKAKKN